VIRLRARGRFVAALPGAALAAAALVGAVPFGTGGAQEATVRVIGEPDVELGTVSPSLVILANGFVANSPLRVTFRVGEDFSLAPPFLVDTTFTTSDTVIPLRLARALPPGRTVYWRALVERGPQAAISPITGPRLVPAWITLVSPNSPLGDILDTRTPTLRWRSPRIDTPPGPWRYALEITSGGAPVVAASGITDTSFTVSAPLQASTPYRWEVTASLADGARQTVASAGTFIVVDPAVPTTTLFYQNFPNPFPTALSSETCFWFDVGARGAEVSLEILDLRGTPVTTIVPAFDGQRLFPAGRYGRGAPGAGSNCNGRFVWNGTARDGRPVPPGVYLARFTTSDGVRTVRRVVFRGR
jgi:hypothetical protein